MEETDMQRGSGFCVTHGMMKVNVGSKNICVACDVPQGPGSGIVSVVDDPGTEKLEKLLMASGIAIARKDDQDKLTRHSEQGAIAKRVIPITASAIIADTPETPTIHTALQIMRNLPMPSNVKQFKKIQKIIKGLEELIQPLAETIQESK